MGASTRRHHAAPSPMIGHPACRQRVATAAPRATDACHDPLSAYPALQAGTLLHRHPKPSPRRHDSSAVCAFPCGHHSSQPHTSALAHGCPHAVSARDPGVSRPLAGSLAALGPSPVCDRRAAYHWKEEEAIKNVEFFSENVNQHFHEKCW